MNLLDLLIGKKMKVMTDVKVEVELEIKNVEVKHYSEDLEPATASNDWWPASREWTNYIVYFTNGGSKIFNSINEIEIVE
jgi:hypothetical protein